MSKLKQNLYNMFGRNVPVSDLMESELYEAEVALLEAQTALEWAQSNVEYQSNRVARLKKSISAKNILKQSEQDAKTLPK